MPLGWHDYALILMCRALDTWTLCKVKSQACSACCRQGCSQSCIRFYSSVGLTCETPRVQIALLRLSWPYILPRQLSQDTAKEATLTDKQTTAITCHAMLTHRNMPDRPLHHGASACSCPRNGAHALQRVISTHPQGCSGRNWCPELDPATWLPQHVHFSNKQLRGAKPPLGAQETTPQHATTHPFPQEAASSFSTPSLMGFFLYPDTASVTSTPSCAQQHASLSIRVYVGFHSFHLYLDIASVAPRRPGRSSLPG